MAGFQRILVAVRDESQSEAVYVANELAQLCGASVNALFVEDINLIRSAQLGCVSEIGYSFSRTEHTLDNLERKFRARASLIQKRFLALAGLLQTKPNFSVVRGVVPEEILRAQQGMDLLMIGWPSRSGSRFSSGDPVARIVMERTSGPILFFPQKFGLGKELLVIRDTSGVLASAEEPARILAKTFHRRLRILEVGSSGSVSALPRAGESGDIVSLSGWHALYQYLALNRQNLLVLPRLTRALEQNGMLRLLQEIGMPLLLVEDINKTAS